MPPVLEEPPCDAELYVPPSPWTRKLELFLNRVGTSDVPVLLQGETGVGKEVLARQICRRSPRANKPFLKLNCAALPSELVESELFGYERGAFTGAFRNTPGKFEMANGGTILLDEIGDMDFKLQAKLLQVLQDGEFSRLGAGGIVRVNVRVIAATHCDLEQAISDGRFREDLYYRLNIIRIEVPPLRDRREEILPLAQLFLAKHSKPADGPVEINPNLSQALTSHSWPGNIRELENVMRTLVVLREPDTVAEELRQSAARRRSRPSRNETSYGPDRRPANDSSGLADASDSGIDHSEPSVVASLNRAAGISNSSALRNVNNVHRQAEIQAILRALNTALWNRKQAAELLGVEYKALLYKMKKLGIEERALSATP